TVHFKCLLRSLDLFINNLKWELRRDHPETAHHPFQSFGSDQRQGFRPVRISHCKEQPRKATDMISVIVGEADHIDRLETPSLFFYRNLGSLTAVDQQAAAV